MKTKSIIFGVVTILCCGIFTNYIYINYLQVPDNEIHFSSIEDEIKNLNITIINVDSYKYSENKLYDAIILTNCEDFIDIAYKNNQNVYLDSCIVPNIKYVKKYITVSDNKHYEYTETYKIKDSVYKIDYVDNNTIFLKCDLISLICVIIIILICNLIIVFFCWLIFTDD